MTFLTNKCVELAKSVEPDSRANHQEQILSYRSMAFKKTEISSRQLDPPPDQRISYIYGRSWDHMGI